MAKKRGYYEGMMDRRALERRDAEMIGKTTGYYANMPDKEIVKLYPTNNYEGTAYLNDGIEGIDYQMKADNSNKKKETFPEKY